MFTFPESWAKVRVTIPWGHPDGLRICRNRARRNVYKAIETNDYTILKPDPIYNKHIEHICYHTNVLSPD